MSVSLTGSSRKFKVSDPATGKEIAEYPLMSAQEVEEAVGRARTAFGSWSKSSFSKRKHILERAAEVLAENAGRYAEEVAAENGKTRFEAMLAEIFTTAELMKYYAKNGEKFLKPVKVSGSLLLPGRKAYYKFEPKGVIGVISPWNYPLSLSADPVITAVAAGNTVVLKPSSQTTRSGLIVKEIFEKSGLPEGTVEVITGNGSITGQALIEHQGLDMLYFTGSTEVGREINIKAAERLVPAVMELGGKDVAIVTKNADLTRAANGIAWASFTNCGQTCISTELVLVQSEVYDEFVKRFTEVVGKLRTGKSSGEVGPLTMESQLRIVDEQLEDAREKGAEVLVGGNRAEGPGMFYLPTVLAGVTPDMKLMKDETFGPLKPIVKFDTVDEAIRIANSSEYGLSGSVYTRDLAEGRRIADGIKTGSVNINDTMMTQAFPGLPFGGVKKSGIGRNHGKEGLIEFTDIKSITEYGGKVKRELIWYPVPAEADKLAEKVLGLFFVRGISRKFSFALSALSWLLKLRKKR